MIKAEDIILGFSTNQDTRHDSTSGGIGSAIIQYLFETKKIKSAISFEFVKSTLEYKPYIAGCIEEYHATGSIYQEINLISYIKENIKRIPQPFACFALPCQVTPIQNIIKRNGSEAYIFELTCSSQQSIDATRYLIKRSGISQDDIQHIRYRGKGWPGGIQIVTNDNREIFFHNNNSLWTKIFHSHLFIQPRCYFCGTNKNTESDLQLADPWGIDPIDTKTEGRTMCYVKSNRIAAIMNEMSKNLLISYTKIEKEAFIRSQLGTIIRKNYNLKHKRFTKFIKELIQHPAYKRAVLSGTLLFNAHCFVYKNMYRILHKISSK